MQKVKTVIGIISYNDKHYLERTFPIIAKLPDTHVIIIDNACNDEIKNFIEKEYPQFDFIRHPDCNIGFGRGHNFILENAPKSDYFFCLNPDIYLEEEGYKACVKYLDENPEVTMLSSKLYHWDIDKNSKTNIIDTLGIVGNRAHKFWDRGQNKEDKGQYDDTLNNIFGISGAAFFIRRDAIQQLHGTPYTLFDEGIFMYKEDIDLSYRLRWLGLKIHMLPNVLGYHDRTLGQGQKKSDFLAKLSYRNHLLMLKNNFSKGFSIGTKWNTLIYESVKFFYYLFTKPKVSMELFKVFKLKVKKSVTKIKPKQMESYLLK
ncbi:glycosyltransferase family 2 protein [Patescibacteria group bacterium]|nr:glycosyltransferase family 2 protein [Patescibacteria group bacterium]